MIVPLTLLFPSGVARARQQKPPVGVASEGNASAGSPTPCPPSSPSLQPTIGESASSSSTPDSAASHKHSDARAQEVGESLAAIRGDVAMTRSMALLLVGLSYGLLLLLAFKP